MKALILAAGYATRLYPLTKDRPKALLPIAGRPMLNYLMDGIASIPEMDEVHIVTNHRFFSQFQDWALTHQADYPALRFVVWDDGTVSNDDRLGAVGDMNFVLERAGIEDDLLVAASDNFFTFSLNDYVESFRRSGRDTLLCGRIDDLETLRRFAVAELDENGDVISLIEKPEHPKSTNAVYALYIYRRDTLPLVAQFVAEGHGTDSPGRFPEWLHTRKTMRVYVFGGECVDIGTPESYREVCERYAK